MTSPQPKVEAFLAALAQQSLFGDARTPGSVLWYIEYYKTRAPRRRQAFRVTGFILLFLSISLPFFTGLAEEPRKAAVASGISWAIALIAAANAFFNWQKAWQLYTQAQLTLQFVLSEWELCTAQARAAGSDDEGVALLHKALDTLSRTVSEAVANETAQYFEGVTVPEGRPGKP